MTVISGKSQALADLIFLSVSFWTVFSLKHFGVGQVDVLTMGTSIVLVLVLLRWRGQSLKDIGVSRVTTTSWLINHSFQTMAFIALTALLVGGVARLAFGDPSQATAISQQPTDLWLFILDLTVVVWVFIAFGEELVFRGFILNRLILLFDDSRRGIVLASLLQAVWFGGAHPSQGITGMLTTGAIGFVLAMLFVSRLKHNLWPLVIAHGLIDSIALTVNWLVRS